MPHGNLYSTCHVLVQRLYKLVSVLECFGTPFSWGGCCSLFPNHYQVPASHPNAQDGSGFSHLIPRGHEGPPSGPVGRRFRASGLLPPSFSNLTAIAPSPSASPQASLHSASASTPAADKASSTASKKMCHPWSHTFAVGLKKPTVRPCSTILGTPGFPGPSSGHWIPLLELGAPKGSRKLNDPRGSIKSMR